MEKMYISNPGSMILKKLLLEGTPIKAIPDLSKLAHLEYLDIEACQHLESVPSSLPVSLKCLHIDGTTFTDFSVNLSNAPKFYLLMISNSNVETFTPNLSDTVIFSLPLQMPKTLTKFAPTGWPNNSKVKVDLVLVKTPIDDYKGTVLNSDNVCFTGTDSQKEGSFYCKNKC